MRDLRTIVREVVHSATFVLAYKRFVVALATFTYVVTDLVSYMYVKRYTYSKGNNVFENGYDTKGNHFEIVGTQWNF